MDRLLTLHSLKNGFYREVDDLQATLDREPCRALKRDKDGVVAFDENGTRTPISDALVRKLESQIKRTERNDFFDKIVNLDPENLTNEELREYFVVLQSEAPRVEKRMNQIISDYDSKTNRGKNFFELDGKSPIDFIKQSAGLLNPEEIPDFFLMAIYQTWANITNSPKIPLFDYYLDIISKVGFFEANPMTSGINIKMELNNARRELNKPIFRVNMGQEIIQKYNDLVITVKGCNGYIGANGYPIITEVDSFLDMGLPNMNIPDLGLLDMLPDNFKRNLQIREYSWTEIAVKARLIKLIELAYEKGLVHALTNHVDPFQSFWGAISSLTGVPNISRSSPAHH